MTDKTTVRARITLVGAALFLCAITITAAPPPAEAGPVGRGAAYGAIGGAVIGGVAGGRPLRGAAAGAATGAIIGTISR